MQANCLLISRVRCPRHVARPLVYSCFLGSLLLCRFRRWVCRTRRRSGQMEDEELKNFRRQWRKADKDNSGTLDKKEIVRLLQKVRGTVRSAPRRVGGCRFWPRWGMS